MNSRKKDAVIKHRKKRLKFEAKRKAAKPARKQ